MVRQVAFWTVMALSGAVGLAAFAVDQPKNARDLPGDPALKPKEVVITGYYLATGKVGEEEYEGVCVISPNGPNGYAVQWTLGGVIGVGLREGNALSVGMRTANRVGVARYQIERDAAGKPKLVGTWTVLGDPTVHTETLEFLRPLKE